MLKQKKQYTLTSLLEIMKTLRDPIKGCPWDQKQTINSIVKYTIEEVYEVVEAIEKKDSNLLKTELGDLLFQIIFYCQICNENGDFDFFRVIINFMNINKDVTIVNINFIIFFTRNTKI